MSLNALVIGNDLAAFVTALRLQHYGYTVRVIEAPVSMERPSTLPVVLHGPTEQTESLLQQNESAASLNSLQPVSLEFLATSQAIRTFRHAFLPAPWHTVFGVLSFPGLSVSSRWKFLSHLERMWEGEIQVSQSLHLKTAQDWLISCGQNEESRHRIWNPLCLFLLGDQLERTAAWPFIQALKQHFLDARIHSRIRISSVGYVDLFLSPLRNRMRQLGIPFLQADDVRQIRISGDHVEGVSTDDGHTHKSDVYIATVSPFQLTALLPERTLTRIGFFHQLNQLDTVPAIVLNFSFTQFLSKPRLLLTSGMFHWMTWYSTRQEDGQRSFRISCVATANEQLHLLSDEQLRTIALQEIRIICPGFDNTFSRHLLTCDLIRYPRAFTSYSPGTMTFRPCHQTPIKNLFLAGHWTNTNAVSRIEGDIQSANLCAELIRDQTSPGQHSH